MHSNCIKHIERLQITKFVTAKLSTYGLIEPRSRITFPEGMATLDAKRYASMHHDVETLARMGMVLTRLAGKPQEAERRFREALEAIHRPWPYLLGDEVVTTGKSTGYLGWPPKGLEQAIEYDMRLPLLILASKMGAAPQWPRSSATEQT